MTTSVSPCTRDLTSNQASNPVLSFSSVFFCHRCFHLRTSAHAVPVSVVLPLVLLSPWQLLSCRHVCHLHREDNSRPHDLVGPSTFLCHCPLFIFFTTFLTMCNDVLAGLFCSPLSPPPICMFHEDRDLSI